MSVKMIELRLPSHYFRRKCVRGGLFTAGFLLLYWLSHLHTEPMDLQGPLTNPQFKYPHQYRTLLDPGSELCGAGRGRVKLLVLVASALNHFQHRRAVRQTWGSIHHLNKYSAKLLFLLGSTAEQDEVLERELGEENASHRDILREQYIDSYSNLTIKSISGFKWAVNNCHQAEYVMKTDDDIYVNVAELSSFLAEQRINTRAIYGCIKNGPQGAPQPLSVSGIQFGSVHPPFTAGAGYVLSADIVPAISNMSQNIRMIRVEDAFMTGYCAARLGNVQKVDSTLFSCGQIVNRNCDMKRLITGHKINPERMREIHTDLKRNC